MIRQPPIKHINNRSDFGVAISFYDLHGTPQTVPSTPFRMIFTTSGGGITYEVNSIDPKYCKKLNATTLLVCFDFSNHEYFRNGELLVTFAFSDNNSYFCDGNYDTRHPLKTGYMIWDGASDVFGYLNVDFITDYNKAVEQYPSRFEFPNVGREDVTYIDQEANKTYRWDNKARKYYCVGSDYNDIEVIDGGSAKGLNKVNNNE